VLEVQEAVIERVALVGRAGDRPEVPVGPARETRIDGRQLRQVVGEARLLHGPQRRIDDEARGARRREIRGPSLEQILHHRGGRQRVHAHPVEHDAALLVLVAVREVEDEAGLRGNGDRRASVARYEQDRRRRARRRVERAHRRRRSEERRGDAEAHRRQEVDAVARREHEVVDERQLVEARERRRRHLPVHADAVARELVRWPEQRAEVDELAGRDVALRMRGEGKLRGQHAAHERGPVAQAARVVVALERLERVGIEPVREPALPEREELAAVEHDARVRGVLEVEAQQVLPQPAGEVRAEAPVEHPARALLGDVLVGAHEAVPVAHAFVVEREARDHAVTVERMLVLRAEDLHLAWPVAIQHAAQAFGQRALGDPQRDVDLVRHRLGRAEIGVEAGGARHRRHSSTRRPRDTAYGPLSSAPD